MGLEGMRVNLKQYIINGFVRMGAIRLIYALCLLILTGGLGYGAWNLHQSNQFSSGDGLSFILEYLMLTVVGVLLMIGLTLLMNGIKSFQHFQQFMKATDVRLVGSTFNNKNFIQIGVALDYLEDETIVYENRQVVLTNQHLIILAGDFCIYPLKFICQASFDLGELGKNKKPNLAQLKTVVISVRAGGKRKITCKYLQEAMEVMKRLEKRGIKVDSDSALYYK